MTIKSGMAAVHPGEVLREELDDIGLSANALAKAIDVPTNRVTAILNGNRGISADTALRLGRYFDTTPQFWLNLQQSWQIRRAELDAGPRILERVVSRETEALQKTARAATESLNVSAGAVASFRAMERNLALCGQLNAVERSLRILDTNEQMLRAFESPLNELRIAGVFDTTLRRELRLTQRWLADYENRFQLPSDGEISRLVSELKASWEPMREVSASFQRAVESMKRPWLDVADRLGSVQRLFDLQGIGELTSVQPTFDLATAETLRASLGDWRDTIAWPEAIWTDLGARADFYIDLGFDAELTDIPAPAFREATKITTVRPKPPSLVNDYGPPVSPNEDAEEEEALARTNEAHDWLQRLESQLRRFIDREMTSAFGASWPRHQLPNNKHEEWRSKRKVAARAGVSVHPLITYADFTDYMLVICQRDNWERVFKRFFKRPESVRESLQRLYPIRLDTMHARPITKDDELFLYVETKRLMQPIGSSARAGTTGATEWAEAPGD